MPSSFHSDPLHGASDDEFPDRTPDWNDEASRRRFLRLMGASIALAGSACTKQPKETIVPYVRQPEQFLPGQPLFYASAMTVAGIATGVLVESHLGRPTKIEGNPDHPASLGATNAMMQASILTLYDPDRSQTVKRNGEISTWGSFLTALVPVREAAANKKGAGLCVLTGSFSSPSLAAQIQDFKTAFPEAKWHQWEPCGRHAERAGAIAAFGQPWNTVYRFDRADRIVSLDADFLDSTTPGHLKYTRDYTARRRGAAENASAEPPRMYVVESTPSITGGMAEHRFSLRAADVEGFAASLARELGLNVPGGASTDAVRAIAKDLMSHRGSSIVIPGQFQPPRVHAIAHLINQSLGNVGQTLYYTDSVEADPVDDVASLTELVTNMRAGMVDTLFILGGNPVYDAPADVAFLDALQKVKFRTHLGLFEDETAAWCHWHVPQAHYLESWGDTRAWDGTTSIVQPLISPIYDGKTASEVLSVVLADAFPNQADRSAHDTVRAFWENQHKGKDFTGFWQTSLHDGVIAGTQFPAKTPPAARVPEPSAPAPSRSDVEITFRPDPTVGDGSLSNNAWLQELPKPQNKMTWDNAIWISPITAEQMRIALGDLVELTVMGRTIRGPVWIQTGQADGSATIHFGYGRSRAGRVANGVGFNAYQLRTSNALWQAAPVQLKRVSSGYAFALTQRTQTMEGRDPVRVTTLEAYRQDAASIGAEQPPPSLFPVWEYRAHKWGMSIDLTSCIGCNACMAACQAENNIPTVGKEEVAKGRHMNWIRVDRYFSGPSRDPEILFQPVPCMHCENAPCELVCPVAATVHSGEGLNEMVYNRCVGTRYCSNNCPYKVRRFNFFLYADWDTTSLFGLRNPDVTVRSRGVMEKCTYCVQRINRAKIDAEKQDRPVRDGEIVTACQQACPAEAIVFGDLNDPNSKVSRRVGQKRSYGLLEELNTRPRTTYLARLRNPNPEIQTG